MYVEERTIHANIGLLYFDLDCGLNFYNYYNV